MPLKAILTKEEYEALDATRRELYVEKDGKYVLDAEGVEDVTGLKNVLNATRAEVKKLKADLQATVDKYKDIDPDRAREAQRKLDEMEEKNLLDAGKVDELVKVKTERMRQDYESQIKAFNKKIGELETDRRGYFSKLSELLIDNSIREAALLNGVKEAALPDVLHRGKEVSRLKENTLMPMKDDQIVHGKDSNEPLTMELTG